MKTVILDNIYRNGNLVTTMFRNGSLIYQRATKHQLLIILPCI